MERLHFRRMGQRVGRIGGALPRLEWRSGDPRSGAGDEARQVGGLHRLLAAAHSSRRLRAKRLPKPCAAPDDEVRGDQDRRATGSAGVASGARAASVATHRHHQPDPRLHAGTRDRVMPRVRWTHEEEKRLLDLIPQVRSGSAFRYRGGVRLPSLRPARRRCPAGFQLGQKTV